MNGEASSRVLWWQMALQQYDFDIYYRPGKQNANGDALSRMPMRAFEGEEPDDALDEDDDPIWPSLHIFMREKGEEQPEQNEEHQDIVGGVAPVDYINLYVYLSRFHYPEEADERYRRKLRAQAVQYETKEGKICTRVSEKHGAR